MVLGTEIGMQNLHADVSLPPHPREGIRYSIVQAICKTTQIRGGSTDKYVKLETSSDSAQITKDTDSKYTDYKIEILSIATDYLQT